MDSAATFSGPLKGSFIYVWSDNTVVMIYINHQGDTKSQAMGVIGGQTSLFTYKRQNKYLKAHILPVEMSRYWADIAIYI